MKKHTPNELPDNADDIQNEIYKRMSPAEKWQQAQKLRETAWMMKTAAIRYAHPEWSQIRIEQEVRSIFLYAAT